MGSYSSSFQKDRKLFGHLENRFSLRHQEELLQHGLQECRELSGQDTVLVSCHPSQPLYPIPCENQWPVRFVMHAVILQEVKVRFVMHAIILQEK